MSAIENVLADLKEGQVIKTDNLTCFKYSTNQIPDVIRRIRVKYPEISKKLIKDTVQVKRNGRSVNVAEYRLGA